MCEGRLRLEASKGGADRERRKSTRRFNGVISNDASDQFPLPTLNARCRFSQRTFAGTQGNERDAPISVIGDALREQR